MRQVRISNTQTGQHVPVWEWLVLAGGGHCEGRGAIRIVDNGRHVLDARPAGMTTGRPLPHATPHSSPPASPPPIRHSPPVLPTYSSVTISQSLAADHWATPWPCTCSLPSPRPLHAPLCVTAASFAYTLHSSVKFSSSQYFSHHSLKPQKNLVHLR